MDEWEKSVPRGPKRRGSEPIVDDANLHKTYDSYKPSYDSYRPREPLLVYPRRRPTAEEYWGQGLPPVASAIPPHEGRLQENPVRELSSLRSKENRSSGSALGGSRRSSETLSATTGDRNFTQKEQGHTSTRRDGADEQPVAYRSPVTDPDNAVSNLLPKRSKPDGLQVNTEVRKILGSKINQSATQTPTAAIDPRLILREGSGLASAPLSGNVTPQSASMQIDTPISGHKQTGMAAGTVKPCSFPVPHARGNNDNERDNTAKHLSRNLSSFAHSVTETASLTIRRDAAQSKATKMEKESKKWQNLSVGYASLAEEQAKTVRTLNDAADRIDERLLKFRQAQDETVKMMAATMVSVSSGTTASVVSPDNSNIKFLEGEVEELKEALKAIHFYLEASKMEEANSKSKNTEFQDNIIDPENLRNQLGQTGGDQGEISRGDHRISALKSDFEKLEREYATVTVTQIPDVQKQLARCQEQLNSAKDDLNGLEAKVGSLIQSLQILNGEVFGTNENESTNNHKSRITRFQEDIAEFIKELRARMETTDIRTAHVASLATAGNTHMSQRLEALKAELAQVARELAAVISDQKVKDELVGQEVERLDQTIVAMQADLVKVRPDLSETRSNQQPQDMTAFLAQGLTNGAYFPQPNLNRVSPQDGVVAADLSNTQSKLLDDYNNRLVVCETVLANLQQRYDNLSTAELARNMVHQMSTMYPYPAQVLAQLEQLGRNYNTLVQTVANLSGNYSTLGRRVDAIAQTTTAQRAVVNRLHEEKIMSLEAKFTALSQRSATPGNTAEMAISVEMDKKTACLNEQLAALKADLKENSLGLKDINKVLDIAKNQYQSTVASLQSDLQTIRETLDQKYSITEHETFNILVQAHVERINKGLEEKEEVAAGELGKMHEEITAVMKKLGMRYRGESQEPGTEGDDGNNDPDASDPVATSASPAVTVGQRDDSMSEDSDPVRRPTLGRSILATKKHESKRKRHSGCSDSDANPKRKPKLGQ